MLAKTLAELVAMVKEIKEGQQAYTATLKQNSNTSYVKPTRHCGICSCDSHYTDECPHLQDDNPIRGNLPQQQQGQQQQPYTYSQPQNNQNVRYQPPHNRQQPYPPNNPPLSVDEAMRIYQKENQEIKEIQKRIAEQIVKLYEMMQDTTNQLTQVPPPVTNPPPAQLSQKGEM
ncbi:hypothetical protein PIB30_026155 [Stylosanthes scabra]|uniref:Uncharacterized protein n=1 Tax=Stylosanthes scabra TaxID=79078 RepID=A0ABU6VCK9_9FABA|nr:hypothetical protein [Stylosanthes scabra]